MFNKTQSTIQSVLNKKICAIIKGSVSVDHPGNSTVYALSAPIPMKMIEDRINDFLYLKGEKRNLSLLDFNLGLNVVQISGNEIDKEGLHVHLSHIFAIVFEGEGILYWEDDEGIRHTDSATKGDCVIIPRGVMHYFTGKMSFAALEVSDIIDYQKHHYSSIE